MYISAEGAQAQSQRLEVIANNLANVETVGFKQDVATFQARFAEAIQQGLAQEGSRSQNDLGGGVKVIDVQTDFSPGRLQRTGNDFDMAIVGNGFFSIGGENGETYLSRAGNFTLDPQGKLVTQNGNRPVLDQGGGEIVLNSDEPWSLSQDGFLAQSGNLFALGIFEPESLNDLVKVGNNLFRSPGTDQPVELPDRNVRQGFLELSSSNPTRQMMAMIETTRAFEANTRMIQSQDGMIGSLIGRLLQG